MFAQDAGRRTQDGRVCTRAFTVIGLIAVLAAFLAIVPAAWAQPNVDIVEFRFDQNFKPGDTMTFTARLQNNESSGQTMYVDFVMTNKATAVETEVVSSAASVAAGATQSFTATGTASQGLFTVTVIAFHTGATDTETDRKYAPVPIRVGTATQQLSAFPNAYHFGTIPPGRNMYPQPIKVTWDFFLFNRLRRQQPFYIRIYTDNSSRFKGVPGAIRRGSPAGLVSGDGMYTIPLRTWCLNFGPALDETGWNTALMGPPPVEDNTAWLGPFLTNGTHDADRAAWQKIPDFIDMTAQNDTWRILIGQDPYDTKYVKDNNQTGDFTLPSPFEVYLATDAGPSSVRGEYYSRIVIEMVTP